MNLPKIVPHDQWLDARKGCPHLDRSRGTAESHRATPS